LLVGPIPKNFCISAQMSSMLAVSWWPSSIMWSSTFGRARDHCSTVAGSTAVSRLPWKTSVGTSSRACIAS